MSELLMRGHFRYLRFKTFPMTPRKPQCEVFCPLLSSSEHSGVPEDSQPPTFPSVGLHPTLGQSGVATRHPTFGTFWPGFIKPWTCCGYVISSLTDLASCRHTGRGCCDRSRHIPLQEINECVIQSINLLLHHCLCNSFLLFLLQKFIWSLAELTQYPL